MILLPQFPQILGLLAMHHHAYLVPKVSSDSATGRWLERRVGTARTIPFASSLSFIQQPLWLSYYLLGIYFTANPLNVRLLPVPYPVRTFLKQATLCALLFISLLCVWGVEGVLTGSLQAVR